MFDKFGRVLTIGVCVVYPTRPGGKGPLQLGFGSVSSLHEDRGEVGIEVGTIQGEPSRIVFIKRTDRLATVGL